jgi:NADH-quinone oxidoreductase subunit N
MLLGTALIIVGVGFKLAVVPFHMWTPDVYEGAPAPATALLATVSKGAVFALVLRYFAGMDFQSNGGAMALFSTVAIASMVVGNMLALLQNNVKRILAYSSIAHLGYLLVAFVATGPLALIAVAFYLAAYFVTTLGAFGVITVLSKPGQDRGSLEDYRSLGRQSPWLAGVFTAMVLSLAGIPLTAGFMAKFSVMAAGIGSALWLLVTVLVVTSIMGLYYYLRVIVVMYGPPGQRWNGEADSCGGSRAAHVVLAVLVILLLWMGVYPSSLVTIIEATVSRMT